ncbi:MAG TPA: hypothetical protein VMZ28_29145 [Kofleriaceae bacterium]|nr:hypothetical protein [Kofleriaceae bacterium]
MKAYALAAALAASLAAAPSARAGDRTAVLLLKRSTPERTVTTFGKEGKDASEVAQTMAREIEALGFKLAPAIGQQIAVTGESDPRLPIGDAAALELARKVGAQVAWVVGIDVRPDGRVRATRLEGAAGRGAVRVLEVGSGNAVATADVEGAGFDATASGASTMAARDISERLARAVGGELTTRWPASGGGGDDGPSVTVRVRGARTWNSIAAVIRRLATTEGISAVHPRDVRRGRVSLSVDTRLTAGKVASAAERARLPSGTARAAARGAEVDVEIRGETTFTGEAPATETPATTPEPSDQD